MLDAAKNALCLYCFAPAGTVFQPEAAEWGVKVFADVRRMREWLLGSDPAFVERRRGLPETPGSRYFQEKRLTADAERAVRVCCRAAAQDVQAALKGHVVGLRPLRAQANPESAIRNPQSGAAPEMILNLGVLVDREDVAAFRGQVDAFAAAQADRGLSLTASGPWPPYSFCPALGGPRDGNGHC